MITNQLTPRASYGAGQNRFHDGRAALPEDQVLHVGAVYSNPFRWRSRRVLFQDFRAHMAASENVRLYVCELAYGDREFEVTSADNPDDVRLRTNQVLWHKENLGNLLVRRFQSGWRNGALIDGDFHMTRQDWALEAIQQLHHAPFVQLYSNLTYLSPAHRPHRLMSSFAWNWLNRPEAIKEESPGAVGGAWAFTRDGFNQVGGMLQTCILGSGDWHMAFGLIGKSSGRRELLETPPGYAAAITSWQQRAFAAIQGHIGCVDNLACHYHHGMLKDRAYGSRVDILLNNKVDPHTDTFTDWQGVLQLTPNKPQLKRDIDQYFLRRNEDSLEMNEKHLV